MAKGAKWVRIGFFCLVFAASVVMTGCSRYANETEAFEPEIRYTTNGTDPTPQSALYTSPIGIDRTTTLRAAVFLDGKSMEQVVRRDYVLHKAFDREVSMKHPNSPQYDGQGEYSLVNGIRGTRSFTDGNWKGFNGSDLVATIDLGEVITVNSISMDALQTEGSWIFLPFWVSFETSEDGKAFQLLNTVLTDSGTDRAARRINEYVVENIAEKARYVRITAKNQGVCPPGHPGAGQPAWLFVSEIKVQ